MSIHQKLLVVAQTQWGLHKVLLCEMHVDNPPSVLRSVRWPDVWFQLCSLKMCV